MATVLIADDDPVSLRFLSAALTQLDCQVIACANGMDTLKAAQTHCFNLLLLDRCMPDIGGRALLEKLRAHGVTTPALATSAEFDSAAHIELKAAGFSAILAKPITLARLETALQPYLQFSTSSPTPEYTHTSITDKTALFDDCAALMTLGGDANALAALRGLLAHELKTLLHEFDAQAVPMEPTLLHERLHRLRASCGFCGAVALASAATRLSATMSAGNPEYHIIYVDFVSICQRTLDALIHQSMICGA